MDPKFIICIYNIKISPRMYLKDSNRLQTFFFLFFLRYELAKHYY